MSSSYPSFPVLAGLLAAACAVCAPVAAGTISPRLPTSSPKGLLRAEQTAVPVIVWPKDGQGDSLPGVMERLPDGAVLARLTPEEIAQLEIDPSVAYAAPQDEFAPPDLEPLPEDAAPQGGVSKDFGAAFAAPKAGHWPEQSASGIRIGIIDFGRLRQGQAERGYAAQYREFGEDASSGAHIGAVVSLIHHFAPKATLLVASLPYKSVTTDEITAAADWLVKSGARIINFSGVSYRNRRDGKAELDTFVDMISRKGILWIAASGNEARRSWIGSTLDRDGDGLIDVPNSNDGQSIRVEAAGGPVSFTVSWDDWANGGWVQRSSWAVGLKLVDRAGREVASAMSWRPAGLGEPIEIMSKTLAAGSYWLRMPVKGSGNARVVRLTVTGAVSQIAPFDPEGSIGSPGTAQMALTVGSVARPGYSTAPYSGRGPTADGRSKPETVAIGIDGASAGTSYAAPRASALAARLLAQNPSMSVEQLKAEIRAHSAPLGGRRNARAEPATWIDSTDFE